MRTFAKLITHCARVTTTAVQSSSRLHVRRAMSAAAADANDSKFTFDAAQAEYYEHTLTKGIFLPWTSKLFDVSRPVIGDNVLDVATGTGVVAIECAKTIEASVGDASASARARRYIRVARAKNAPVKRSMTFLKISSFDADLTRTARR